MKHKHCLKTRGRSMQIHPPRPHHHVYNSTASTSQRITIITINRYPKYVTTNDRATELITLLIIASDTDVITRSPPSPNFPRGRHVSDGSVDARKAPDPGPTLEAPRPHRHGHRRAVPLVAVVNHAVTACRLTGHGAIVSSSGGGGGRAK